MTSNDAQYDDAVRLLAERPYLAELVTQLDRTLREYESSRTEAQPTATTAYDEEIAPSLLKLAQAHAREWNLEERTEAIEAIGSEMDIYEAGTVRRVAKAVEGALPDIVLEARISGASVSTIARELGFANDSRVYHFLRNFPWEASYRVDRYQNDEWVKVDSGLRAVFKDDAEQVAVDVYGEQDLPDDAHMRVSVWRAGDPGDFIDVDKARYVFEHEPTG